MSKLTGCSNGNFIRRYHKRCGVYLLGCMLLYTGACLLLTQHQEQKTTSAGVFGGARAPKTPASLGRFPITSYDGRLPADTAAVPSPLLFDGTPHLAPNERLLVTGHTVAFHGGSALQTMFRSSPAVATLCDMVVEEGPHKGEPLWQCEPQKGFVDPVTLHIYCDSKQRKLNTCNRKGLVRANYLPLKQRFEFYGRYWDLQKPVFYCKHKGFRQNELMRIADRHHFPMFQHMNITRLYTAQVITWRPLCLFRLSSHSKKIRNNDTNFRDYLHKEIKILELKLEKYTNNTERKQPQILLNYGSLLWDHEETIRRMLAFLPSMGSISFDYSAPEHSSKIQTSIKMYSESHNPQTCCGYDPMSFHCSLDGPDYNMLSADWKQRAQNISAKLAVLSSGIPEAALSTARQG